MGETDEYIAEYKMGQEAEEFWGGELGRYILGRIEADVLEAGEALSKIDPDDRKSIIRLQNKIKVAKAIEGYFCELIQAGRDALIILDSVEEIN